MQGGTKNSQGFTIVETLIVMSVTALMFVIAVIYISGRQNKAMFLDATSDVISRIDQTMSEVQSGVFPSTSSYTCTRSNGVRISSAPSSQGANQDCIYLGKVILFGSGNSEQISIGTLVGTRLGVDGSGVSISLGDAKTRLINGSSSGSDAGTVNPQGVSLSTSYQLKNGLAIQSMCVHDNPSNPDPCNAIIGIAIVTSPSGQVQYDGGALKSGSITATVIGLPKPADMDFGGSVGATTNQAYAVVARALGGYTSPSSIGVIHNPRAGIELCFASGTTDQSVLVTVSGHARGLTTDKTVMEGRTCGK